MSDYLTPREMAELTRDREMLACTAANDDRPYEAVDEDQELRAEILELVSQVVVVGLAIAAAVLSAIYGWRW